MQVRNHIQIHGSIRQKCTLYHPSYKKGDTEYISDGYFHESEYGSAPAFDIAIDGITSITE